MNWLKYYKTVDNDGVRIPNHEKKLGKVISGRPTNAAEARRVVKECRESYNTIVKDEKKQQQKEYKELKWNTPTKPRERD